MKKILLLAMIVLFLFGMQHTEIKEYTHTDDVESETSAPAEENVELLNASFTLSTAGDCTLATDINARGPQSFDSTFTNNDSDYSYFFKNVKTGSDLEESIEDFEIDLSNNCGIEVTKEIEFEIAKEIGFKSNTGEKK